MNLKPHFKKIIIGLSIIFLIIFFLFYNSKSKYWYKDLMEKSIAVDPLHIDKEQIQKLYEDIKLVSLTGNIISNEKLGDPSYLKEEDYIILERFVEKFTKEIKWIHHKLSSAIFFPKSTKIGVYNLNSISQKYTIFSPDDKEERILIELPKLEEINLNIQNTILKKEAHLIKNYIFIGKGSLENPQIGDIRISFKCLKNNTEVTVFGRIDISKTAHDKKGNIFKEYKLEPMPIGGTELFRLLYGRREEALNIIRQESPKKWIPDLM